MLDRVDAITCPLCLALIEWIFSRCFIILFKNPRNGCWIKIISVRLFEQLMWPWNGSKVTLGTGSMEEDKMEAKKRNRLESPPPVLPFPFSRIPERISTRPVYRCPLIHSTSPDRDSEWTFSGFRLASFILLLRISDSLARKRPDKMIPLCTGMARSAYAQTLALHNHFYG